MAHAIDEQIQKLLTENGEMHTREILAAVGKNENTVKKRLSNLKADGVIEMPKKSIYRALSASRPVFAPPKIPREFRTDNKETIETLMGIYDDLLAVYKVWFSKNVGPHTDFETQLLFMENFKWLTAIGDRLMKRWSLEHVGYDTNTRQAQEDAKAKTAEREKAALKDAPLEDKVHIVGHFHTDLKQLWDDMPASEREKQKV